MIKKINKKYLIALLILTVLIFNVNINANANANASPLADQNGETRLIAEYININEIPGNFRKTTDAINQSNLNVRGLKNLNISGSRQFSGININYIIKSIGTKVFITVVDLRQESHGFVNNISVSWMNNNNNANANLSTQQVIEDENEKLVNIKLNEPIKFYNKPNLNIIVKEVTNENNLVKSKGLNYIRIPITDRTLPVNETVDDFVAILKNLPENTWIHFHCKHGIGRTTTAMIMFDIMKNYKVATSEEIVKRQLALTNFKINNIEEFNLSSNMKFFNDFYKYCTENGDLFKIKWSEWIKLQ